MTLRRKMKGAKRSKYVWLGLAVAMAGFLETQYRLIESLIPEKYRGLGLMLIGMTVVVLRFYTTQPLDELGPNGADDQDQAQA